MPRTISLYNHSSLCSIDRNKYAQLLSDLSSHLEFANQLMDFSTAYEHRQYIGLLEKLQKFSKQ